MPEVQIVTQGDEVDLMREAYRLALFSPDPRTQNGAVLATRENKVVIRGWNDFPVGVKGHSERWHDRNLKLKYVDHAEATVIHRAAMRGTMTSGLTMVCPYAACDRCAVAIIAAGIWKLVVHKQIMDLAPPTWRPSIELAHNMLREARVEIVEIDQHLGCEPIRFDGGIFQP